MGQMALDDQRTMEVDGRLCTDMLDLMLPVLAQVIEAKAVVNAD